MRFLFITVAEDAPGSLADLRELLDSIAREGVEGEMILVMRGGDTLTLTAPPSLRVHVLAAPLVIPLSVARNRALDYARRDGTLDRVDVVAFPDDDCAYPEGALHRAGAALSGGEDFVCGPYRPDGTPVDGVRFPAEARRLTPSLAMRVVASGSVFFAVGAVTAVGDFDTRLGLGARYRASEDSDYAIRALRHGATGLYLPALQVQHPYKRHRPTEYYLGNVAVLAKHARAGITMHSLVHRLVVGAGQVARGRLPAREYGRALAAAVGMILGGGDRGQTAAHAVRRPVAAP